VPEVVGGPDPQPAPATARARRASRTAQYVALYRALETLERGREPLFRDDFAARFLTPDLRLAVRLARLPGVKRRLEGYADRRAPGARTSAIGRTRFIDDVVRGAAAEGLDQLVILGAGYDARAHRLPALRNARIFEVDRAETQREKRARLAGCAAARDDVRYVPLDLAQEDLGAALAAAGWSAARPTIFVWEGVTNYLRAEDVAGVLRFVGGTAPRGRIVFTYVHRGAIDGSVPFPGAAEIRRNVERLGEPWTFGLAPEQLRTYLAGFGLALEEDLGADAYRARFLGSDGPFAGYAFYRVAVARVERTPGAR